MEASIELFRQLLQFFALDAAEQLAYGTCVFRSSSDYCESLGLSRPPLEELPAAFT